MNPDRGFRGVETVRERWSTVFESVPDFRAELLRTATGDDAVWSEWRWTGTGVGGIALDVRGVTITGIRDDRTPGVGSTSSRSAPAVAACTPSRPHELSGGR